MGGESDIYTRTKGIKQETGISPKKNNSYPIARLMPYPNLTDNDPMTISSGYLIASLTFLPADRDQTGHNS